MWPAVKRNFSQEGFRDYVEDLTWNKWRPSKIVWHNTAAPSLRQWIKSAMEDAAKGIIPGRTRIGNLESFFKDNNGWSGCPHLFIANDFIWVMNPLTAPGVHSPSYNSTSIGIEMIGDFSVEDDDSGEGLRVKNNTILATALLCSAVGIEATAQNILLHKEDKRTTHDCPGKDVAVDKLAMVQSVADLMAGGEHDPDDTSLVISGESPPPLPQRRGVVKVNDLNLREGPGVTNKVIKPLSKGTSLIIFSEAKNGTTTWLRVQDPSGRTGWVSGSFVEGDRI